MEYCDRDTNPFGSQRTDTEELAADGAGGVEASRDDDVTNEKVDQFQVPNSFVRIRFEDLKFYECCGEGSFGSVYRARWGPQNNQEVAVKQLRQMDKEAHVLSILSHRNIIQFFGAVDQAPNFAIVTEYAPYGSLFDFLATAEAQKLEFNQVLTWSRDIALGMNYLHEEAPIMVVHRDLKSKNVVICNDFTLKICDFGASRFFGDTVVMTMIGTYPWMAPELIQGLPTSERCDVYSFGVVLWEQLTREVPFRGLQGFQVAWAVVENCERPLIPACCPERFAALMKSCWCTVAGNRPSFYDVIMEINSMMGDGELEEQSAQFIGNKEAWMREIEEKKKALFERERELGETRERLRERERKLGEWEREMREQMKKQTVIGVARYRGETEKLSCAISGKGEGAIHSIKNVLSHIMANNGEQGNSEECSQPRGGSKAPFIESSIDFDRSKTDNVCKLYSEPAFADSKPAFADFADFADPTSAESETRRVPRCKVRKQASCEEYNFRGSKVTTTSSGEPEVWESAEGGARVAKSSEKFEFSPGRPDPTPKPPPHLRLLRSHHSTPALFAPALLTPSTPDPRNKPQPREADEIPNKCDVISECDVISALRSIPLSKFSDPDFARQLCRALNDVITGTGNTALSDVITGTGSKAFSDVITGSELGKAKKNILQRIGSSSKLKMTSLNNSQMTSLNSSQMTSSNNSQVTSSNNSQMTSSNNSQVTSSNNAQMTSSINSQVTSSNNSQMTSSKSSQMTSSNNSQMTSSNNSQMTSSNNSQLTSSKSSKMTSSNNSQMTSSNNSQMTSSNNSVLTSSNNSQVTSSNNSVLTSCDANLLSSMKRAANKATQYDVTMADEATQTRDVELSDSVTQTAPLNKAETNTLIMTSQSNKEDRGRRSAKYSKSPGRLLPSFYRRYFSDEGTRDSDVTTMWEKRSMSVPEQRDWRDDVTMFQNSPARCMTSSNEQDSRRSKSQSPECSFHPRSTDSGCGDSEAEFPQRGEPATNHPRFGDRKRIADLSFARSVPVLRHQPRDPVRFGPTQDRPREESPIPQIPQIPRNTPRRISLPGRFSSEVVLPAFRNPAAPSAGHKINHNPAAPSAGHKINQSSAAPSAGHKINQSPAAPSAGHQINHSSAAPSAGHKINHSSAAPSAGHKINHNPAAPSAGHKINQRSDIFETDDFTYIIRPRGRK